MKQKLNYGWVLKADREYNNVLIQNNKLKEAYLRGVNDYHNVVYKEFVKLEEEYEETIHNLSKELDKKEDEIYNLKYE